MDKILKEIKSFCEYRCFRAGISRFDAQDVAQEVLIYLTQNYTLQNDMTYKTLVNKILTGHIAKYFRDRKRESEVLSYHVDIDEIPLFVGKKMFVPDNITAILIRLAPATTQELLQKYYIQKKTLEECMKELNLQEAGIRKRLQRGKAEIRKSFNELREFILRGEKD